MGERSFYNIEEQPWAKELEANVDVIRKEMLSVLEQEKGVWFSGHPSYVKGNFCFGWMPVW